MQSLASLLDRIEDIDTATLRSLNQALVEELTHRGRKEQVIRASTVQPGQVGTLVDIKPAMLKGVRGTIERLSSDSKAAYFRPLAPFSMGRYLGPNGLTKIYRSTFRPDPVQPEVAS